MVITILYILTFKLHGSVYTGCPQIKASRFFQFCQSKIFLFSGSDHCNAMVKEILLWHYHVYSIWPPLFWITALSPGINVLHTACSCSCGIKDHSWQFYLQSIEQRMRSAWECLQNESNRKTQRLEIGASWRPNILAYEWGSVFWI